MNVTRAISIVVLAVICQSASFAEEETRMLRIGVIGLDTSHAIAFTEQLNDPKAEGVLQGCRVVAAYPKGSPDIQSSVERVPQYTEKMKSLGVEIVESIDALIAKSDAVLLETNDGRPHLEQALPVLNAKKPCFIDKPLAGSLIDAAAICLAAEHFGTPMFTGSSHRFAEGAQKLRAGELGKVLGCDTYSPCALEATHPDLFWYGIHGVEALFTVMGPGCERVSRVNTPDTDVVVGIWKDGRVGTFRGTRSGTHEYGGTAFTSKGIYPVGPYRGYRPQLDAIIKFFRTGTSPVSAEESLDIYAFMEAADESKRQGGKTIPVAELLQAAKDKAKILLAERLAADSADRD